MQLVDIAIQMHGIIFSALLTGLYARWSCCVDTSTKEYVKSTQITGFAKRVNLAILQRFFSGPVPRHQCRIHVFCLTSAMSVCYEFSLGGAYWNTFHR